MTEAELRAEAEKARSFEPKLRHFTLATSAHRDAAIQQVARALTQENTIDGLFGVDVWGWEDLEERLASIPNLMQMHYPQFERPGDSETTTLLQSIMRRQQEETEHALVQNRPRFEVPGWSVTNTESRFMPAFKCKQISGDPVGSLVWSFRGPRFHMDPKQLQGSQLDRATLGEEFDLSRPLAHDNLVDPDQMGLELRFYWRGGWRSELHRWPITRKELPTKVHWEIGAEILPPLELDDDV